MGTDHARILRSARMGDLLRLARRVAGLQYLAPADFLPDIGEAEAQRICELSARARGAGPAPILVLGVMPRSGTNFLRDLLALHPDVCADPGRVHEFPLLHAARGAAGFMDEYLSLFPANAEVSGRWDALALLSGAWLREFQHEAGARQILLKSPHVQNLSLAPHVFPGARIILCVRDGRDVIESTQKSFSRWALTRKTFAQLAREWGLATAAVMQFAPGAARARAEVMVVRYEDVVAAPGDMARRLLDHAGLDPAAYDFHKVDAMPVRGSSRSQKAEADRWLPERKQADFNPVRRWAAWSDAKKARFDRIAGDVLEAAGYER